jgi:hypothetical protein
MLMVAVEAVVDMEVEEVVVAVMAAEGADTEAVAAVVQLIFP